MTDVMYVAIHYSCVVGPSGLVHTVQCVVYWCGVGCAGSSGVFDVP